MPSLTSSIRSTSTSLGFYIFTTFEYDIGLMLSKRQGVFICKTFWPCNVCWCGNSLGGRNEGSKVGDIVHPFKGGPLNLLI
jgi:hypothetical protein